MVRDGRTKKPAWGANLGIVEALRALSGKSLAVRLIAPVTLIFLAFSVALGVLVSVAVRGIYLREAAGRAETLGSAADEYLKNEWTRAAFAISNPVTQRRFAPLLAGGNVDAVTRALRELKASARASLLHAYDGDGAFLTSSEESVGTVGRHLKTLAAGLAGRPGEFVYVALPEEALRSEGLETRALVRPRGLVLAGAAILPLRDDFGDPVGSFLFLRVLTGDQALVKEIGRALGGEVTLVVDRVAVATTLPGVQGRPALGQRMPTTRATSVAEVAGGSYQGHYHALTRRGSGPDTGLWTAVPVSALLHRALILSLQIQGAGLVAAATFALLIAVVTRRSLRHVPPLLAHMERVSAGQLLRLPPVTTGDEIESLARGLDRTVVSLRDLVDQVKASFDRVGDLGEGLARTADSLAEGNEREREALAALEATANNLAHVVSTVSAEAQSADRLARENLTTLGEQLESRTALATNAGLVLTAADQTQEAISGVSAGQLQTTRSITGLTSRLAETAAAVKEIDEAIGQIRDLTETTRDVAVRLASEASERGQGAMERVNAELESTGELVKTLVACVETLGKRSVEVGDIIHIISDVTSQSKLLALNASILAAQAGEHGRAFSVVADNMRSLSESTGRSARTIVGLIEAMQEDSRHAVAEAAKGVGALERSNAEVDRLRAALRSIVAGTGETSRLSERMAAFTDSQATASSRVASSIHWIASTAQELSASMEQQTDSGKRIVALAQDTRERATAMKRLADEQAEGLGAVALSLEMAAQGADRLLSSAGSTDTSARVLREALGVIRGVSDENRDRVDLVRSSVERLTTEAEQVKGSLSAFRLE